MQWILGTFPTTEKGAGAAGFLIQEAATDLRQIRLRNRTGGVQAGDCWAARRDEQAASFSPSP